MLLHITTEPAWDAACAAGSYRPASLADEGFIHASTPAQAVATANKYFRGRGDLILLCIDEARVTAEVRYERPAPIGGASDAIDGAPDPRAEERFPHIYGPLALDAVVRWLPFPCDDNGAFVLPAGVVLPSSRRVGD